jgi:hypothetical protein
MNFRELPYNKLQNECKLRGIKANSKVLELIAALEEYESSKKKDDPIVDIQVSADLDDGYFNSFSMFGINVDDIKPVSKPINNEVVITPVTKVINKPVVQSVTTQVNNPTVTKQATTTTNNNKLVSYEQLESFYSKGFICLNNNSHITGIDARIMLSKLWVNYPITQQYLQDYEDHTSLLKVQFGLSKEITEAKKIVKKSRNLTPATVEHGKPKARTIYVSNDRGNNLGLPSEHRSPYKSGLKNGVIDHNVATSIYIDDKLLFSTSGSVVKLQSQAYTKNGKSKEHKADCGYIGKSKNTKNKRSTGVKLTSSVQVGINTNLMGNLFKLAGNDHKIQVEISSNGTLYLNQYIRTEKIQSSIGKIGELDSNGRYQIEYATSYKLASNAVVDRHIQAIIIKALHHDTSFMMSTKVIEPDHTHQINMKKATNNSKRATRKDKYDNGRYRKAMFNEKMI